MLGGPRTSTHHFDGIPDHISDDLDIHLLSKAHCSGDCLVLDAGIPLRLHDENTIGGSQIQSRLDVSEDWAALGEDQGVRVHTPKRSGASRHDQHPGGLRNGEIIQDLLSERDSAVAIDSPKPDLSVLQVPTYQVKGLCPAGKYNTEIVKS